MCPCLWEGNALPVLMLFIFNKTYELTPRGVEGLLLKKICYEQLWLEEVCVCMCVWRRRRRMRRGKGK